MKRERLMYKDYEYATGLLRSEDYHIDVMVNDLLAFADQFPDFPGLMGDLTLAAMGMGHIELAEALVELDIRPGSGEHKVELAGDFRGLGHTVDGRGLTALHLLAAQEASAIVVDGRSSGRRRPRTEVLAHILANPETWGGEVDALYGSATALIRSQSSDKHAGSLKYFPNGALPRDADLRERNEFQVALIQAGANINHPGSHWSFLAASIPMAPPDGAQDPVDMSEITRALALGADPVAGAAGAWAQAILQDAPNDYAKGQGPGQRAKALRQAGIGLAAGTNDQWHFSPVFQAFSQNAQWVVEELLGGGVDIGAWRDGAILHSAPGMKKSAAKLLDLVPREQLTRVIMSRGSEGQTPLHEAVAILDPAMVARYLGLGADPNAKNNEGQTPLEGMRVITAKMQPKFEAIFALLDAAGATTETQSSTTALHKAALMLSASTCRTLIDRGLSVYAKDKAGNTPLETALFGHQQSTDALFNDERGRKQADILTLFSEHGVDLFSKRAFGRTLLHEAMGYGNHRVAIALLEAGADPNAEDDLGLTPMHTWSISEHLREQGRNNPGLAGIEVPGRTMSIRLIKADHHPHIRELFRAFLGAGGQVRAMRFGMPAFGHVWQHPVLASALDSDEMEFATPKTSAPMQKRQRI